MPHSHCWLSQENTLHNYKVYAEDLAPTHPGSMLVSLASVSTYEPCLVESVGHVLLVLSGSYNPVSPLHWGSPSSA